MGVCETSIWAIVWFNTFVLFMLICVLISFQVHFAELHLFLVYHCKHFTDVDINVLLPADKTEEPPALGLSEHLFIKWPEESRAYHSKREQR